MKSRIRVATVLVAVFAACAAVHYLVFPANPAPTVPTSPTSPEAPTPESAEPAQGDASGGEDKVADAKPAGEVGEASTRVEDLFLKTGSGKPAKGKKTGAPSLMTTGRDVLLYLGLILLLIFGGIFILKRAFPSTRRMFKSEVVQVMGRTYISPKQFVCLVRVGGRMLVLGCTSEQINVLSEISDSAEVAQLHESTRRESADSVTSAFLNIFKKKNLGYAEDGGQWAVDRGHSALSTAHRPPSTESSAKTVQSELDRLKAALSARGQGKA